MKKLAFLLASSPGLAWAHGAHVALPGGDHVASHLGPWLGAGVIALAIGLALAQRGRP